MLNKRIFVISYSIPNRSSGTPVVIRKFLENFNKDEIVLMGRPTLKREQILNIKFHYPIVKIPTPPVEFRSERLWRFLSIIFGIIIGLFINTIYQPKLILAFYRDESSLLTGYILHKITKKPFYAYFCDLYLENYPSGFYGKLAAWLQPRVFKSAKKIFVLTEGIAEYYQDSYNLETVVLPHCNNQNIELNHPAYDLEYPVNIGYLGGINIDRVKSLKILCNSIKDKDQFSLNYFTSTPKTYLEKNELLISNSKIERILDDNEMLLKLSQCDILFLPVLLDSIEEERFYQVNTGFPTKVIEYLICQKPIILHSKKNFFVSRFFLKYNCGLVVDEDDDLLTSLSLLIGNRKLREELSDNSKLALNYFDGKKIVGKFNKIISQ